MNPFVLSNQLTCMNRLFDNYTSRLFKPSEICCTSFRSLKHGKALDEALSRCSRKSITTGSVHGDPKGASGPATHPRWPPLGVNINKQFGFAWDNSDRLHQKMLFAKGRENYAKIVQPQRKMTMLVIRSPSQLTILSPVTKEIYIQLDIMW